MPGLLCGGKLLLVKKIRPMASIIPVMIACLFSPWVDLASSQASEKNGDWIQLFNGVNLNGWKHVGSGRFLVENHLLKTEGEKGLGLLWYTHQRFGNATIRVVFKFTNQRDDSGFFVRIPKKPSEPWMPINRGYEVEIGNCEEESSCTGVLYSFTKPMARPSKPVGEWNILLIVLDGPRIAVVLNGVQVTDYREGQPMVAQGNRAHSPARGPRPLTGYIGLQNYGASAVYFKEVAVKRVH